MRAVLVLDFGHARFAAALAAALLASGCSRDHGTKAPEPVNAACDRVCFDPCTTRGIVWDADPSQAEAWDRLGDQAVQPLAQRVQECSRTHRRACHLCLWRLQERGLITGIPDPKDTPEDAGEEEPP